MPEYMLRVSGSPEAFERMDSRKRVAAVQNAAPTKRARLFEPDGFCLDSPDSIFDSDGLISFPGCESSGVTGVLDAPLEAAPIAPQEPSLIEALKQHQDQLFRVASPSVFSEEAAHEAFSDSSPSSPSSSSVHSVSSPTSNPEADTSLLQLTIAGMISCLRRISDLAVVNPQLAQDSNLYDQVMGADSVISNIVQSLATTSRPSSVPSTMLEMMSAPTVSSPVLAPSPPRVDPVVLRVNELETLWYADRPYPSFECELVDPQTNQRATYINNCRVEVSLVDGHGNPCDKLTGQASSFGFVYPVSRGVVELTGLRFGAVSSKHGGHFQLRFDVLPAAGLEAVEPVLSSKIQVLSYRLFHAPKVDFSKLQAHDPLTKVKGIGSLYAKRFAAIGIVTVQELAALEVDSLQNASAESKKLLENLRKDRGALTLSKLNDYIAQAREIVARSDVQSEENSFLC